jgi:hypothetical protein
MIDTSKMDTKKVLETARKHAQDKHIKDIVIATTTGKTGVQASKIFDERFNLIAVTHSTGFKETGDQELIEENKKKMLEKNVKIFTGPMIFHSWNDFYKKKYGAIMPTTIIADTLRIFGQGTKVTIEIIMMTMDAGLISNKPVMSIGGTCRGADTVLIAEPRNSQRLFDMKIMEIVAKPFQW